MGGLLVLFLIGLYLWGAYKVVRWIKPVWGKALAVVVVVLIPTADAVYGRIKLNEMCEKEGGVKMLHIVSGVEGFYDALTGTSQDWVAKNGYRFTEGKLLDGRNGRVSMGVQGKIITETDVVPKARYVYQYESDAHPKLYLRSRAWIKDVETNEILSEFVNFQYAGGWVERFVAGLYAGRGNGGTCGPDLFGPDLIKRTLKPVG